MRAIPMAATALMLALAAPAQADQAFTATLAGHALLPAQTFIAAPADAPDDLKTSGKFTGPGNRRIAADGSIMGLSAGRPTGVSVPFQGQPQQGHSGIKAVGDGTFWVLTDNGFGSKANSPDSMLYLNHLRIDWASGKVERLATVFLSDPNRKVPFRIANEGTKERYLTGSDFDLESFQPIGDKLWFGEEFGPFLIRADRSGKVEAVFETMIGEKPIRSPDNPYIGMPASPDAKLDFQVRRSKGYEGMAASKDGRFLYPMLEGALWDSATGATEKDNGVEFLRVLEFDVAAEKWTGRWWKYPLAQNGLAIGDFNMIDATTALVIERDNGEGTPDKACPANEKRTDCFHDLPKLKRVYKVEFGDMNVGQAMRKIGHIDLLQIRDPKGLARQGAKDGVLPFPFFTIENVDVVDATHIIVGNDNNLPFSSSRDPNKADDNEFVLLEVGDFLKAR